ncbi:uncharacterized protein LOC132065180 isoform X3 [Lycium ferocissimum]|uniref:uncharacterized protein LOC132065180 isoform X3 n=1 Tax=Lycium ferocissimum TaxID=112874 RepID=UPI002814EC82|nr:uncharacterized protein LOC132065180 isoform X3 [Lycium ferocissimum]
MKLVYIEGVHVIWMERNKRQFEKVSNTVEAIAKEVAITCSIRATPIISSVRRSKSDQKSVSSLLKLKSAYNVTSSKGLSGYCTSFFSFPQRQQLVESNCTAYTKNIKNFTTFLFLASLAM